jgi:serine O-acetyltransferase
MKYGEFSQALLEQRDDHALGFQVKEGTREFVDNLLAVLFPHFCKERFSSAEELGSRLVLLERDLRRLIGPFLQERARSPEEITDRFMSALRRIHNDLWLDAEAIHRGDPAAESVDEVILAYPGFTAIAIYRLAHEFYLQSLPIFPRLLTEYAHQVTGIDIHPGADIGTAFAIDHGTGIVIGESTMIGKNVKLYQGVTLGALSVDKKMAKSKRHPTIEHDVVIYAQAVILGGETCVGHHSIIGGNVWLTESVEPYSVVYQDHTNRVRSQDNRKSALNFVI